MNIKKRIIFTSILSLLLFCSSAFVFTIRSDIDTLPTEDEINPKPIRTSNNDSFTIKEFEGKIAVYDDQAPSSPLIVYNVYTSTLPQVDKLAIADGITVQNVAELNSLIEDYTS